MTSQSRYLIVALAFVALAFALSAEQDSLSVSSGKAYAQQGESWVGGYKNRPNQHMPETAQPVGQMIFKDCRRYADEGRPPRFGGGGVWKGKRAKATGRGSALDTKAKRSASTGSSAGQGALDGLGLSGAGLGGGRNVSEKAKAEAEPSAAPPMQAEESVATVADMAEAPSPSRDDQKATIRPGYGRQPQGQVIYLSNDDSMSLSSPQRIEFAIDRNRPIPAQHLRPYEFLNYYKFESQPVMWGQPVSVMAQMAPGLRPGETTLAFSVRAKNMTKADRRTANLTFVVDQSGSMAADSKMNFLKRGLHQVYNQLKDGDLVNVVQFNHNVCVPLTNFIVGRDDPAVFHKAVDYLESTGSTNLNDGLNEGYRLADRYYRPNVNSRLVLITDAIANTGVTDKKMIASITQWYDRRKISLSGIGVGADFNDDMLNELTELGRGAYLFLAHENAVDRVFGDKFVSLLETVARDVHFKATLPPSMKMETFYGEEASTNKADVQPVHLFANSTQLFLSDLKGSVVNNEAVLLDVDYEDPQSGQRKVFSLQWKVGNIFKNESKMIDKARTILTFTDMLGETSPRLWESWTCACGSCFTPQLPPWRGPRMHYRYDKNRGRQICSHYASKMSQQARQVSSDPEVQYVFDLATRYCDRFGKGSFSQ